MVKHALMYTGSLACEDTLVGVVTADGAAGIAALHDLDPEFRSFSRSEKVAAILESLHIKRPLPVQSMYIFKVGFQLSPCMHVRSAHHCQVWLGVSGQTVSIHPILALYSC